MSEVFFRYLNFKMNYEHFLIIIFYAPLTHCVKLKYSKITYNKKQTKLTKLNLNIIQLYIHVVRLKNKICGCGILLKHCYAFNILSNKVIYRLFKNTILLLAILYIIVECIIFLNSVITNG